MSLETTKLVVDILQGLSVIGASIAAVLGINAWKREHLGKRRIELAEEVLTHLYKAQDVLERIRSPQIGPDEAARHAISESVDPEERIAALAFVFLDRYNKNIETFQPIYALRFKFKAVFGLEDAAIFDEFEAVFSKLRNAAIERAKLLREQRSLEKTAEAVAGWQARWRANQAIYEATSDDRDPIAKE